MSEKHQAGHGVEVDPDKIDNYARAQASECRVDRVVMQSYEYEGITLFRDMDPRFEKYTDVQIRDIYRAWSRETASAGWLSVTTVGAKEFIKWAFTYPADFHSA